MALNVLAVYEDLGARISETAGFAGHPKSGWRLAWERGRSPTDLASRNPGAAEKAAERIPFVKRS